MKTIPFSARIFAVVDAYDAMTSDRPYREALPHATAAAELRAGAGTQFDPRAVDALLQYLTDCMPVDYAARATDAQSAAGAGATAGADAADTAGAAR